MPGNGGLAGAISGLPQGEAEWLARLLDDASMRAAALDDYHSRSALCRLLIDAALRGNGAAASQSTKIPRRIMQYWDQGSPPDDVAALMQGWRVAHPDWEWQCFDAASARDLLTTHCAPDAVAAFDRCTHPVMRCDLFRLLHVHAMGGVYVDADEECLAPLESLVAGTDFAIAARAWLHAEEREIAPAEALQAGLDAGAAAFYFNNAPLFAVPGHAMLGDFAAHVVGRLLASDAVPRVDELTAPQHFTRAVLRWVLDGEGMLARAAALRIVPRWYGQHAREHWLDYKNSSLNWRS